jgi:hypothetical protein
MQFFTTALAAAAIFGSSLAVPLVEAEDYQWSVTQWSFLRGQNAYDYSLKVKGAKNGETPKFTAFCEGTQKGGYKECVVSSINGAKVPQVYANVNIVTDPNDPNDNIPRVFVKTTFTNEEGCIFTSIGHHDATISTGTGKGSKFPIFPKDTAIC